jgi:putative SOS response-associated peptidase YedK
MPILTLDNNKLQMKMMNWGFPKWDGKGVIINAVSETAAEKSLFAKALAARRCVVPSTGFYEWRHEGRKVMEKYLFNCAGKRMLYMAGLHTVFHDADTEKDCFVILTRAANQYISDIHDRMPVILDKENLSKWIKNNEYVDIAFKRDDVVLERVAS